MKKKEYIFLIFIALALSFVFVLPHLLIPKLLNGKPYYPLVLDGAPIFTADELTWPAAEAREVMDGRLLPTDPVVWEYKKMPSLVAQIPAIITGLLGWLTGSINKAFIILGFVLPPLVFLVIFYLVYLLTHEHLISSLTSVVIMTMTRPFQFVPPINKAMINALFSYLTNRYIDPAPIEFFRLPNPLLIFPFFILTIIFLFLALERKKKIFVFLGGVFFGLLFYLYFYFWTFVLAGVTILLVGFLVRKDWQRVRFLLVFLGIAGLLSLFYWLNFYQLQKLPWRDDVLIRAGLEIGRTGNLFRTAQFLIFGFLFSLLIKKKDWSFWFLLSMLLGGVVCLNLQLLTGFTFQSFHWTLRVINPWVMLMLGFVYFRLLEKKRFYKLLTIFLLFIFLVLSFGIQLSFSRKAFSAYTLTDEKIRAFNWLNENTPKDSVVGALGLETNTLIPVYTHNNVFLPNGGVTLAPTKEITKRIYIIYKLFGITPEYLDEVLAYSPEKEREKEKNCFLDQCLKNRRLNIVEEEKAMSFFHMQDTVFQEGLTGWSYKVGVPPKERMGIVGDYKKFLESSVYLPHDLRLDYIFFGAEEKKITKVNLKKYDFLLPVYQEEGVEIYKVKDQKQ